MVATTKMTRNFQVTVPKAAREQLGLDRGDIFAVEVRGNDLVLRRQQLVDEDQAWFHTEEWQERMQRAQEQFASGDVVGPFESVADYIAHAEERAARRRAGEEQ